MKQKLIDANELIVDILAHDISDHKRIDRIILDAPTVDAIPVAFIEEKMRKYEELAYNSTPKIQQRYFDKAMAIQSLIDYWHEKNEKGDDDATV